ncbi:MAG: EamA family transporter [Candidatus Limnocylindrales bacterium]
MIPVLGGIGAALMFSVSVLASARASRLIGPSSTVAWAMAVGLVVTVPVALLMTPQPDFGQGTLAWFVLAGIGNVAGLLLTYAAYRVGAVAVVVTIASTEGAIAAVLAVLAGETLAPGAAVILVLIAAGVAVTAAGTTSGAEGAPITPERELRAVVLAIGSAACFGIGLYASGRISSLLPIPWAILPPRAVGVALVVLPLIVLRRLRLTRAAAPFVVAVGFAEVLGYVCFVIGAAQAIAITAVLATLFAPLSAVAAYVLFRERLAIRQVAGIGLVVVGVVVLGFVQA